MDVVTAIFLLENHVLTGVFINKWIVKFFLHLEFLAIIQIFFAALSLNVQFDVLNYVEVAFTTLMLWLRASAIPKLAVSLNLHFPYVF